MEKETDFNSIMEELLTPTAEDEIIDTSEETTDIVNSVPEPYDDEERDYDENYEEEEPDTYDFYEERGTIDQMRDDLGRVWTWFDEERYEDSEYDRVREALEDCIEAVHSLYNAAEDYYSD